MPVMLHKNALAFLARAHKVILLNKRKSRLYVWLNRNRRFETRRTEDGLNVLVETESSYRRTEKKRFVITSIVAIISAVAAAAAAIFSALAYFNS